jgi:hypothetical protein
MFESNCSCDRCHNNRGIEKYAGFIEGEENLRHYVYGEISTKEGGVASAKKEKKES